MGNSLTYTGVTFYSFVQSEMILCCCKFSKQQIKIDRKVSLVEACPALCFDLTLQDNTSLPFDKIISVCFFIIFFKLEFFLQFSFLHMIFFFNGFPLQSRTKFTFHSQKTITIQDSKSWLRYRSLYTDQ